ncbi:MAG: hypothetical protein ACE5IZ_09720 [Dehalococcoidia bacterium]
MRAWAAEAVVLLAVTVAAARGVWDAAEAVGAEREEGWAIGVLACLAVPLAWGLFR